MTDASSSDQSLPARSDPLQGLRELASSPRLLKIAETQTILEFGKAIPAAANTSSTMLVDVRDLAEQMMFDATKLVAKLDEFHSDRVDQPVQARSDMVPVSEVLRCGAAVTFAVATVCLIGNQVSGTILLHPLLAWVLILSSIGFYAMGRVSP